MADPAPAAPVPDLATAKQTLRFLGRLLKTEQFILKKAVRDRKAAQRSESTSRSSIRKLIARIQRELDANPTLFKEYGHRRPEDWSDGDSSSFA